VGLSRKLAAALAVASVASGVATYIAITGEGFTPNPQTVDFLLNLNAILLLLLGIVVARRIVLLWGERRRGLAGSRLHTQLVLLFSAVAAFPAIVMAVFSTLFFNLGLEAWFSERTRVAVQESLAVAEAYLDEHRNNIRNDVLAMASDLSRDVPSLASQRDFQEVVSAQAFLRSLPEVVVFDDRGQVMARAGLTLSLQFGVVPFWALAKARGGELVIFNPEAEDSAQASLSLTDRVRALIRLQSSHELYLMIGRFVDPKVVAHLDRTRRAVQAYEDIEGRRADLQKSFAIMFVVIALLLLLVAVWVGLVLATRLARPLAELVGAAERVRSGDLSARVSERETADEIGSLSRAFNRMTSQLETQRREVVEANRQLDDRRRFTEAVLSGVSSGVIGLDADGRVNLPNRSAMQLLSMSIDDLVGVDFRQAVPEMAMLLDMARASPDRPVQDQIAIVRDGRRRALLVRIAAQPIENGMRGYVVTFDDITELEAAQRKAAWSDVARRIAHEIKNPLTPIQLSAERLKRKYMGEIKSDPETFRICTETIVRQVGDIGRMVDEFSSFARMPAPQMRDENLAELVRQTVFLQRNARSEIRFDVDLPPAPWHLRLDPRQIGQALTNLLQNAIDAIDGREAPVDGAALPQGHIVVHLAEHHRRIAVIVEDNGKGLPRENRERLTEPYVTTRTKGTGLGLAIVKKIMEDHGGELVLEDRSGGGTRVSLVFAATAPDDTSQGDSAPARTKAAVHGT
jgi:two-component system nitrogen regulation sensor histidine kinase NtrY